MFLKTWSMDWTYDIKNRKKTNIPIIEFFENQHIFSRKQTLSMMFSINLTQTIYLLCYEKNIDGKTSFFKPNLQLINDKYPVMKEPLYHMYAVPSKQKKYVHCWIQNRNISRSNLVNLMYIYTIIKKTFQN